jgi:hypothetical protein
MYKVLLLMSPGGCAGGVTAPGMCVSPVVAVLVLRRWVWGVGSPNTIF